METVDLVGLLVPTLYFTMLAIEARWPARSFPRAAAGAGSASAFC